MPCLMDSVRLSQLLLLLQPLELNPASHPQERVQSSPPGGMLSASLLRGQELGHVYTKSRLWLKSVPGGIFPP